jgi:hypothetical protein
MRKTLVGLVKADETSMPFCTKDDPVAAPAALGRPNAGRGHG